MSRPGALGPARCLALRRRAVSRRPALPAATPDPACACAHRLLPRPARTAPPACARRAAATTGCWPCCQPRRSSGRRGTAWAWRRWASCWPSMAPCACTLGESLPPGRPRWGPPSRCGAAGQRGWWARHAARVAAAQRLVWRWRLDPARPRPPCCRKAWHSRCLACSCWPLCQRRWGAVRRWRPRRGGAPCWRCHGKGWRQLWGQQPRLRRRRSEAPRQPRCCARASAKPPACLQACRRLCCPRQTSAPPAWPAAPLACRPWRRLDGSWARGAAQTARCGRLPSARHATAGEPAACVASRGAGSWHLVAPAGI